eukprot:SAG31_NODE_6557_length_1978_cov_4.922299_2_plen_78_part_00
MCPEKRVAAAPSYSYSYLNLVAANGELAGHTTKGRWELAFYCADILTRIATAEQIEIQLSESDAMEWSMFIEGKGDL